MNASAGKNVSSASSCSVTSTGVPNTVVVLMNCNQGELNPPKAGRAMDLRLYGIGAQILRDLGVGRMRLMAAPRKMPSMTGFGLEVTGYEQS